MDERQPGVAAQRSRHLKPCSFATVHGAARELAVLGHDERHALAGHDLRAVVGERSGSSALSERGADLGGSGRLERSLGRRLGREPRAAEAVGQVERERGALALAARHVDLAAEQAAISRLIDRPSPVPPKRLEIEPSACWKASKISRSLSGGMPIPVSVTENATTVSAVASARSANWMSGGAGATVSR